MSERLELPSARGSIPVLLDAVEGASAAVAMVGGADGGFDGPAEALYPTLVEDLTGRGVSSLRLDFRIHKFPNDVAEGVYDLLHGIAALEERGARRIGLVGHSFGGAVVIEAGIRAQGVAAVATLATQTAGAQRTPMLAPTPLLLIHGRDDIRLSPECSQLLYDMAGEPRQLELLEGATHSLRQRREEVRALLLHWFDDHLLGEALDA
jgi:pimeloyl-ACP methyl ester carboxylesterase